ncbi:AAA family ATPase [Salipiger marinus]|uniref:AAA family ATPase n=1 Tax=Salipiger marinus TaxID=555512 RepID=UPI002BBCEA29|nr:AAA family ATPase [Salipiger manganoxidans]MEB3420744.1 AAA family ATPase [Salipiger manganoxidans]
MKLVSVTLCDVRRFTRPVTLAGIGPGLNVLAAPNEDGKSTLFDALQAVFFQKHRAAGKEIKALRPHAGGAPTVSVELDTDQGRVRLTKRWLSRPMAEVHQDGRLLAKGEAAEDWIAALTQAPEAGGPSGLLWVRQGLTALDDGERREQDQAQRARRDLLSSVAGEVEALTGGRRMDRALAQTEAALAELVTPQGRKARGALKAAEDDVARLTARVAELADLARLLEADSAERRRLRAERAELTEPKAQEARQTRLTEARARAEAARAFASHLTRAREAQGAADLRRTSAEASLTALDRAEASARAAATRLEERSRDEAETRATAEAAQTALSRAQAAVTEARTCHATLQDQGARQAEITRRRSASEQRAALTRRLTEGQRHARTAQEAAQVAQAGLTQPVLDAIESCAREARVRTELHARAAPRLRMDYAPGATPLHLDGRALEPGVDHLLDRALVLDLPGLGALHLHPGASSTRESLDEARRALEAALQAAGVASVEAARAAVRTRSEAEARAQEARGALAALAPEGLATLEAARDALPEPSEDLDDLPEAETLPQRLQAAAAALRAAEEAQDRARTQAEAARLAEVRALSLREEAEARLAEAQAALPADPATARAEAEQARQAAAEASTTAAAEVARLASDAPDLDAAEAALTRAEAVLHQVAERQRDLGEAIARLDAAISLRAGEGVEEDLAASRDLLAEAEARADRMAFERDTLLLLRRTLEQARAEAREHYFEPVTRELAPLLRLLWPEAELVFDEEKLLPLHLCRNGQEEQIEVLSGGTREQIALMVRLAFARLLARSGRHAPVILDDALVYTDDARIERMFDALHRQANDLQILVLTCRQRAFRELGGQVLDFAPGTLPDEAL